MISNDEETAGRFRRLRLIEIEDARLGLATKNAIPLTNTKRSAGNSSKAVLDDAARRDLDAIEAVFKKLNAADEAETARRALVG